MYVHNCLSLEEEKKTFFDFVLSVYQHTHTCNVFGEERPTGPSVIKAQARWSREKMSSKNQLIACLVSVNISPGAGHGCLAVYFLHE